MAARLTDKQKKKIIAERAGGSSFRELSAKYGVAASTIKRICDRDPETERIATQKTKQNTADMLDYMESRKEQAKEVLDAYIEALADPAKIGAAKLLEVATAMGIVIDKFVNNPMKHQLDRQKLEIELLKLESQIKDNQPEEEAKDNFLDALNGAVGEVWKESEDKENE